MKPDFWKIGNDIIGAAFAVRKEAGVGMREHYYEGALAWELSQLGHKVERQKLMPCLYKGITIDGAFAPDIIVDNEVIIELKAISHMMNEEFRQIMTYLKLTGKQLGYLINFGAPDFSIGQFDYQSKNVKGIYRFVNNL